MDPEIFALSGGVLGAMASLPQILKIRNTDNVDSFCPRAIFLHILGSLLFMVYSVYKKLPVIFVGSLGSFLFDIYILLKIKKSQGLYR